MKKRRLLSFVLAAVMAFSLLAEPLNCLAAETIALSDAGFEGSIMTDGIWTYWLPDGESTSNKELVDFSYSSDAWMTPPSNGGNKCLKFYLPAAGSFYFTQELKNASAGTYTLTAQSMGGAGETVSVVLGGQVGDTVQKDSGFNNWTTSSGTFTLSASCETLVVGVYVTCTAGGWGYIDNLALTYEAPAVTEPEVTEPEVTEPAVTEPEVTQPEVTEPEVTEPETTEPEATEPIPVVSDLDVPYIQGTNGDFMRGVDVSSVLSILNSGATFKDWDGNTLDGQGFFNLLAASGINWVRLRVWNDPFNSSGNGYGGGNCDVNAAVTMGKWATNAGMKVLVNFHYSDFWADPSKQQAPKAWSGYTADQKAAALESYTYESLKTLMDAGVNVGMVQVGNETTTGMSGVTNWSDMSKLFSAGSKAVRDISSEYGKDILVAIHFTNPETGNYPTYAKNLSDYGVDYDVFASSYYPYWHGTLSNLTSSLKHVADTYGKQVIIAETSWAYTLSDGDGWSNTVQSGTSATYAFSIQGQADEVVAVTQAVRAVGDKGVGIFYWEPAWIPVQVYNGSSTVLKQNKALWEKYGSGWASSYAGEYDPDDAGVWYGGSSWDNQALFDFYGNPLDSLNVFKYMQTGTTDVEVQHSYSVTKSVAPTCTTDGYKVYTCGSCGASYTETIAAIGHSYTLTETVAANCEEDGYKVYTCGNCGDSYTEVIAATGHSYELTETVEATCSKDGCKVYTCDNCGDSYNEVIAATGEHRYTVTETVAATCTEDGHATYTCSSCGDSYTETIAATGHSYELTGTVEATCSKDGYKVYTCDNCGDSYNEVIAATGEHQYTVTETVAATCTKDGYTVYTCGTCGDTYTETIAATGEHQYTVTETVAATCTEDGHVTYTCTDCGDSYTESIASTDHSYELAETVEATCAKDGYKVYTCDNCGDSYNEVIAATGEHQYTVTETVDATCTEDGHATYTCSNCGDTYTETIAATGHSYALTETVAATCTEDGHATYTCSSCGDSYTETIAATGEHQYTVTETVDATCTEDGHITYACTGCDASYTESIAATGHNYVSVTTAATCEAEGYTTHTCTVCGDSYVDAYVAALGHSYVSVTTAATCEAEGYTTHTCDVCGDSYVDAYVAALGHNYVSVTTEAACETEGYTTHTCTVCGDSYVDSYVAALGHAYGSMTVDATCTVDGSITYACVNCGDSYVEVIPATGHSYTSEEVDGYLVYTCVNCGDSYSEELDTTPVYELTSAFADGEQYVITLYSASKYYALSHEDNEISLVEISVDNGVITSEIGENLLWTYSNSKLSYIDGTTTYYLYAERGRGWGGFFSSNGTLSLSTTSSSAVSLSRDRIKVGNYYLRYSNGSVFANRNNATTAYLFTESK